MKQIKCAKCKQPLKDDGVRHGTFCENIYTNNGDGTYTRKEQPKGQKKGESDVDYLNRTLAPEMSKILNSIAKQDGIL